MIFVMDQSAPLSRHCSPRLPVAVRSNTLYRVLVVGSPTSKEGDWFLSQKPRRFRMRLFRTDLEESRPSVSAVLFVIVSFHTFSVISLPMCASQEMTDIVRAIYDMMGKYTYPVLKTDAPKQHVDAFFQVRTLFHLS